MINKKNVLGKTPEELGTKDAIHVAIVSVRAARPISPGERVGLNKLREAEPQVKGCGVADPFLKKNIQSGDTFWLLLCQDEVPNVQHVWEHPSVDFTPPSEPMKRNKLLEKHAVEMGVTYEQLMAAIATVVATNEPAGYLGTKTAEELEDAQIDLYDMWSEWGSETGYEFENQGTECCPEYDYPECRLFEV